MFRFTIRELLLLTVIVALTAGWWIERSRKPEVYYLHLFAKNHWLDREKRDPMHPDYGMPVSLATFSIQAGAPFQVTIPHDYNPTIDMDGVLSMRGKRCVGKLSVFLTAPDLAMLDESITPLKIDEVHELEDPRFTLVISRSTELLLTANLGKRELWQSTNTPHTPSVELTIRLPPTSPTPPAPSSPPLPLASHRPASCP